MLKDLLHLASIHIWKGQMHALIFLLIPFSLPNITKNVFEWVLRYVICLVACFNFELLNVVAAKLDGINDTKRQNNIFVNSNYRKTMAVSVGIQLIFALLINMKFQKDLFLFFGIILIALHTWCYTIGRWSRNATYKTFFAAYISIGAYSMLMVNVSNDFYFVLHYVFACCILWVLIDFAQDIKDIEGDRKEKRKTLPMVFYDYFGEQWSLWIFSGILCLTALYLYMLFEEKVTSLLFIMSILVLHMKQYKLLWDVISIIFVYWLFNIPKPQENQFGWWNAILISSVLYVIHHQLCKLMK